MNPEKLTLCNVHAKDQSCCQSACLMDDNIQLANQTNNTLPTYINASDGVVSLAVSLADDVLQPQDVVKSLGHHGDETVKWKVHGDPKVIFQQGPGQYTQGTGVLEVQDDLT